MMRVLAWGGRVLVVLLLVWFAAKNAEPVVLRGFVDFTLTGPLALVLLGFFGVGLAVGLLAAMSQLQHLKQEVRSLRRTLQQRRDAAADLPPASRPPESP